MNIVNSASLEMGITLQVGGMLVSGDLVAVNTYFDGIGEEFSSSSTFVNDLEAAKSIKDSFSTLGARLIQTDETEDEQLLPQFIHLKNARFFHTSGNPIPSNRGVFWRGRICEVGGFSLGSLSA